MDRNKFEIDSLFILNEALKFLEIEYNLKFTLEKYKVRYIYLGDAPEYHRDPFPIYKLLFKLKESESNKMYYLWMSPIMLINPEAGLRHAAELNKAEAEELHKIVVERAASDKLQAAIICQALWIYRAYNNPDSEGLFYPWPRDIDKGKD